MENFSRTGEYLERLRKVSLNSDVWFANPLKEKNDFLENLKDEPESGPMDYTSYRSNLLNGWKDGQKNKEEYDSQLMPSFEELKYTDSLLSPNTIQKVVFPELEDEKIPVTQYGVTPIPLIREVQSYEIPQSTESIQSAQEQSPVQVQAQNQVQSTNPNQTQVSDSLPVRDNPFAKMTRKQPTVYSGDKVEIFQNMDGWFTSGRCFGILGVTVGGVLTTFSILSTSGSHPMTALGISLISAGIFMFATVGILSAFQNVKERV